MVRRVELLYDLTVASSECGSCIGLVGIDVHCESELGGNAANNVAEREGSAVGGDLNAYDLLVGNAASFCIFGCHVDVALSCDNAAGNFNFALGSYDLAGSGACDVAAFANGSCEAESSCIGEGNFNLAVGTCGSENGDLLNGVLGTYNGNSFFAGELTGLGEHLLYCELVSLTEKDLDMFLC